jgi:FkbM family methyltransferase
MISLAKNIIDSQFPLASKIYRKYRDNLYYKKLRPYTTKFGFQLFGDSSLGSSRSESQELDIFYRNAIISDVIIDIGANTGLFTCIAGKLGKKVLAIEPHPSNLQYLYRNIQINNLTDIEVYPLALSDNINISTLYGGGQGASLLRGWSGIKSNYETLIPINTLDNLISERFINKKLFIKIDVEGNEYHLLQGATALLSRLPSPCWMVENGLTENFNNDINPNFAQIFKLFWDENYEAISMEKNPRIISPEDISRWVSNRTVDFGCINYIFTRLP